MTTDAILSSGKQIVNRDYVDNKTWDDAHIVDVDWSKIKNKPTFNDTYSSMITWDPTAITNLGTDAFTSDAPVTLGNQLINKDYFDNNMDWNKLLNKPLYYPSQISSLFVDSNLNMNNNKLTGLPTPMDNTDAATKAYDDSKSEY